MRMELRNHTAEAHRVISHVSLGAPTTSVRAFEAITTSRVGVKCTAISGCDMGQSALAVGRPEGSAAHEPLEGKLESTCLVGAVGSDCPGIWK